MQGGTENQKEPGRHLQAGVKSSEKAPELAGGVFVAVGGSVDLARGTGQPRDLVQLKKPC